MVAQRPIGTPARAADRNPRQHQPGFLPGLRRDPVERPGDSLVGWPVLGRLDDATGLDGDRQPGQAEGGAVAETVDERHQVAALAPCAAQRDAGIEARPPRRIGEARLDVVPRLARGRTEDHRPAFQADQRDMHLPVETQLRHEGPAAHGQFVGGLPGVAFKMVGGGAADAVEMHLRALYMAPVLYLRRQLEPHAGAAARIEDVPGRREALPARVRQQVKLARIQAEADLA